MTVVINKEFLKARNMSEEEFNEIALKGVALYNAMRIYKSKQKSIVCDCGKLVNEFHLARHLRTKYHLKRV